ncbi:MAG: hypothetical protein RLP44_33005 [Aggregatilineales bacterium]
MADIIFNFVGISLVNWQSGHNFFNDTLGIKTTLNPAYGDWAVLGAAWDGYYHDGTHSLVVEVFDNGRAVTARHWGLNQGMRPAIHVNDLGATIERLRERSVHFTGEIEHRAWGDQIEFLTVEGIRWSLAHCPGRHVRDNFASPQFGHVGIKAIHFDAQKRFYGDKMGFMLTDEGADFAFFDQKLPDHPFIVLERGGQNGIEHEPIPGRWRDDPVRSAPVFLSLMTQNATKIFQEFKQADVRILREIRHHDDWGGTDFHVADADGNPIQVVQYS